MKREELLELLDIENGSEFTYYENLAELIEAEREIGVEAILSVISEVDLNTFAEIVETYFYDTMERTPNDDVDIYNIFEAVKRNLISLSSSAARSEDEDERQDSLVKLAEELDRFQRYYSLDKNCTVTNRHTGERVSQSLRDAIGELRLSAIDNFELDFDLEDAKDYPIEEYIIEVGDLIEE